jgi:hypothetical protein
MRGDKNQTEEVKRTSSTLSQFAQYARPVKEHVNPLLHNKGCVRGPGRQLVKLDSAPVRLMEAAALDSLVILHDEDVKGPLPSALVSHDEQGLVKKGTNTSSCSGVLSDMSELNSSERFKKLSNFFQLPLFEVHSTMQLLRLQKSSKRHARGEGEGEGPGEVGQHEGEGDTSPVTGSKLSVKDQLLVLGTKPYHKCRSALLADKPDLEKLRAELTPKQEAYFALMKDIKTNYISHALNNREIYFQYVAMSRANLEFTNTPDFAREVETLLLQQPKYARNRDIPRSRLVPEVAA